jgi:hypothetical protein
MPASSTSDPDDPDGCPDLDVFADGLRRSLEELDAVTPHRVEVRSGG